MQVFVVGKHVFLDEVSSNNFTKKCIELGVERVRFNALLLNGQLPERGGEVNEIFDHLEENWAAIYGGKEWPFEVDNANHRA